MTIEKPLLKLRPSRIAFAADYILAGLLVFFLYLLSSINFPINDIGFYAVLALIFIFLISPEVQKISYHYKVTSSQVVAEEGIISRKRKSVFLDNVADISVHQNALERTLGFGSVIIGSSSGREHMQLNLKGVRRPKKIAYEIEKLIKEYAKAKKPT